MTEPFDITVVGAGAAGSVLALRLAQLGRRVALIEKTARFGRRPGESLTPGLLPLLDVADLRERLDAAGVLRPRTAHVVWAGESRQINNSGFVADRARFNSLLIQAACEAGVSVIRPARIAACAFEGRWRLYLDDGREVCAGFLADAAGRCRLLPSRKVQYGARTFALCGYWSGANTGIAGTLVEAGSEAWYWGAPLGDDVFSIMAFVDAPAAQSQQYSRLLKDSSLLAPLLRNARCIQQRICDATPFLDSVPVDEQFIKVGEAAVSVDPLSSQGVQVAIGTALHAAVVINTILDRPQDRNLAMAFYRHRVSQSADFHCKAATGLYREQFDVCPTDFWRARAEWPARMGSNLERANQQPPEPWTRIRLSPRARFVRLGASDGCHIFPEDAVELNGQAVTYIIGARFRDLLEPLKDPVTMRELIARWTAYLPMDKAQRVFRWAWAGKWIEAADARSQTNNTHCVE